MWALTRLTEFNKAYHSADAQWDPSDAAANLKFAEGLLISFLLVTPFWTTVGILVHHLTK